MHATYKCVHTYIRTHRCTIHTYYSCTHPHTHTQSQIHYIHMRIYTYTHACMHRWMHPCMHTMRVLVCARTYTDACTWDAGSIQATTADLDNRHLDSCQLDNCHLDSIELDNCHSGGLHLDSCHFDIYDRNVQLNDCCKRDSCSLGKTIATLQAVGYLTC